MNNHIDQVREYLQRLQIDLTDGLENADGAEKFISDDWSRDTGGGGRTMVLTGGQVFEQAGVNFSEVTGDNLPGSATAHRPEFLKRRRVGWHGAMDMNPSCIDWGKTFDPVYYDGKQEPVFLIAGRVSGLATGH